MTKYHLIIYIQLLVQLPILPTRVLVLSYAF